MIEQKQKTFHNNEGPKYESVLNQTKPLKKFSSRGFSTKKTQNVESRENNNKITRYSQCFSYKLEKSKKDIINKHSRMTFNGQ